MPEPMAYVVTVNWCAKRGSEDRVAEICEALTGPTREEPGNLFFQAHRSSEDPRAFTLYQQYVDADAYQAHLRSEHFARLVDAEAVPRLLETTDLEVFDGRARLVDLSPAAPHGPSPSNGRPGGSALRAVVNGAVSLDRLRGTAVVLDLTPVAERAAIDATALRLGEERLQEAGERIEPGDILLLRTDWTERTVGNPEWFRRSPALTADAVHWLVEREPQCVGCDFFQAEAPVQRQILQAGIPLADGLVNLAALPARCEFFAPFYRAGGAGAAPARAFARIWEAA
jgi:quinol monooxygenase YgiN